MGNDKKNRNFAPQPHVLMVKILYKCNINSKVSQFVIGLLSFKYIRDGVQSINKSI